jgi:hypothetical protein
LNLGYVLLGNEIASRLEAAGIGAGFDPRIGYFHGLRYGRSSLALDLLEPHRTPVIDRLTLSVLNRRMFSLDEFEERGAELGVRLAPAALRRYLALYEASLGDAPPDGDTPRARIQAQVDRLRRAVMAGTWAEGAERGRSAGGRGRGPWPCCWSPMTFRMIVVARGLRRHSSASAPVSSTACF